VGEPAGVAQSVAKKRDRFLARFVAGFAWHMHRRDLGAQTRAMERGSMRQIDPMRRGWSGEAVSSTAFMKSDGVAMGKCPAASPRP